jgi:hypothetical protein
MDILTRARNYVAKMPAALAGSGGHDATFEVACVLVRGFSLSLGDVETLMAEYNSRCSPPWSDRDIAHKIRQAQHSSRPEGYLLGSGEWRPADAMPARVYAPRKKQEFDAGRLRAECGEWRGKIDLVWLANRSERDPAEMDSADFLRMMFRTGERVILFTNDRSQGEAVWPDETVPQAGERGMWYLIQPVDGCYHENPRTGNKRSRRSEESVTMWRYVLLESDDAAAGEWLAFLAQVRAEVAAIYSSGGRSVHALLKVDCRTKGAWDDVRARLLGTRLGEVGMDEKAVTAVRLSRLPQQPRAEKRGYQKLLYVRSFPVRDRLIDLPAVRDVEAVWMERGLSAFRARDVAAMRAALVGLEYYGRVRERMAAAARDIRAVLDRLTGGSLTTEESLR